MDRARRIRWRLVLGRGGEEATGGEALPGEWGERDQCLAFLYDREYGPGRNVATPGEGGEDGDDDRGDDRRGNLAESQLTVPTWIDKVHRLFPRETIERIERDGLERYRLDDLVTNPDLLRRARPSQALLRAVLRTKHLMNEEVLRAARDLVRKVIEEILERIARPVRSAFVGAVDRRRPSSLRIAKNFDARRTIRRNLKNWDAAEKRLIIERPFFFSRVRRESERWRVIILVDQSGSMLDSVIHAAVTASVFWGIRAIKTHLCVFDTSVVDLTADCSDPVETLMKVQLGGGTDIGGALDYAETLVTEPRKTIVVLITDFGEGAPEARLLGTTKRLIESGVTILGLAALDEAARPAYDEHVARRMAALGAHVGAMTPGQLADWLAERVR